MTTTTAPGTGLDWVTFTDEEHAESCDFRTVPCSAQATHVGYFRTPAGCSHPRTLYCLAHRTLIIRRVALANGQFYCGSCDPSTVVVFLRMEALR